MAGKQQIVWSPEARDDLSQIWNFYAAEASSAVADKVARKIDAVCQMIQEHPLADRTRDDVVPGLRSIAAAHTLSSIAYRRAELPKLSA